MSLPADMDRECVALCEAMGLVPGIQTVESCCGHGERPYVVWFVADNLDSLPPLVYWFMPCHCGSPDWRVVARTDCGMSPVIFMVEGPIGEQAYRESEEIAGLLREEHAGGSE